MKRWKKIVLGVLAVLLAAAAAVAIWQRNNIRAVYTVLTKSSQDISGELDRVRQEHQRAIQGQAEITVSPPSTAQNNDLLSGKKTAEEVKEELGITEQLDAAAGETAEELVNRCVAELYACEVDIMAQLAEMKQAMFEAWWALSVEERTNDKKMELGLAGLDDCYDLEVVTDDRVKEILGRYRERLEEIGADAGILDDLWAYYCEEKAAEKAYYLDQYMN